MRKARLSAWKERRVITESEKERRRRRIWTTTNILQSPSSLFSISLFSHLLTFLYLCSYIYLSLLLFLSLSSSFTRKKERDTHKDNISLTIESLRPMSHQAAHFFTFRLRFIHNGIYTFILPNAKCMHTKTKQNMIPQISKSVFSCCFRKWRKRCCNSMWRQWWKMCSSSTARDSPTPIISPLEALKKLV